MGAHLALRAVETSLWPFGPLPILAVWKQVPINDPIARAPWRM